MNSLIVLSPKGDITSPRKFSSSATKTTSLRLMSNNNNVLLPCQKHCSKFIERICTYPNCGQNILFCSECWLESADHSKQHREGIVSFDEFIEVCKLNSAANKHRAASTEISDSDLTSVLLGLDGNISTYRTYVRKEEEKLEKDFNEIIEQFQNDIEDIKNQLRKRLYEPFEKYVETSSKLKLQAKAVKEDMSSNQDFKNEFDEFLSNVQSISKPGVKKSYNIKKLLSEVFRIFSKGRAGSSNKKSNSGNNSVNSLVTQNTVVTSASKGSNSKLAVESKSVNELIAELNDNFENKPVYRNKGEANETYRHVLTESRKLYYTLLTMLPSFMKKKENAQILNTNIIVSNFSTSELGNFKRATPVLTEASNLINNMDFSQYETLRREGSPFDRNITVVEGERIGRIDHWKTYLTSHKKGILCLGMVNQNTLVTGSDDKSLRIYSLPDFYLIKEVNIPIEAHCLTAFCRAGVNHLIVGGYNKFIVLNEQYEVAASFDEEHDSYINNILVLKDEDTLVTTSNDPKILLWSFNSKAIIKKLFNHRGSVLALENLQNRDIIASGGRDRSLKTWKIHYKKTEDEKLAFEKIALDISIDNAHTTDITAIKGITSRPNLIIACAANGEIKLFNLIDGSIKKSIKSINGLIFKILVIDYEDKSKENVEKRRKKLLTGSKKEQTLKKLINCSNKVDMFSPRLKKKEFNKHSFSKKSNNDSKNLAGVLITSKSSEKSNNLPVNNDFDEEFMFLTASFDGTLNLWSSSKSASPIYSKEGKSMMDASPYGGLEIFKNNDMNLLQIVTSGNKGDPTLNSYILK